MLKNLAMPVFLSHFLLEDFDDVDDLRKPLPDLSAEKYVKNIAALRQVTIPGSPLPR